MNARPMNNCTLGYQSAGETLADTKRRTPTPAKTFEASTRVLAIVRSPVERCGPAAARSAVRCNRSLEAIRDSGTDWAYLGDESLSVASTLSKVPKVF